MRRHWRLGLTIAAAFSIAAMMFAPVSDPARRLLTPVLAIFQQPSRNLGLRFSQAASTVERDEPSLRADELAEENLRLRAGTAQLAEELAAVRALNARLTGLREDLPADTKVVLVPLEVVSRDAVPARETLLLRKPGSPPWDRLTRGQWAAARLYVDGGRSLTGLSPDDAPVLWDKTLIGRIEFVSGGWCRVKLLTDPDFQSPAEIVGRDSGKVVDCLLVGKGDGKMAARLVERARGDPAVGDLVRLPAARTGLPAAMIVGQVVECVPDPVQPLLYKIEIVPTVDARKLTTVIAAVK